MRFSSRFDEHTFRRKVDSALASVKRVLDATRNPEYPTEVDHAYSDKYGIAEVATNQALAAIVNALEATGADGRSLEQMRLWAADGKAVTLRFTATRQCEYAREEARDITGPKTTEVKTKGGIAGAVSAAVGGGTTTTKTTQVTTTVKEHIWRYSVTHGIVAYRGADPNAEGAALELRAARRGGCELRTSQKKAPHPESSSERPAEVEIGWLLRQLGDGLGLRFGIDRTADGCRTPANNEDVEAACREIRKVEAWYGRVARTLRSWCGLQDYHATARAEFPDGNGGIFTPVLPVLEKRGGAAPAAEAEAGAAGQVAVVEPVSEASELIMPAQDLNALLAEQRRSIAEAVATLGSLHPGGGDGALLTANEASLAVLAVHVADVCQMHHGCIACVEAMLRNQLVAAIGKEVGTKDFDTYMAHHYRKLFRAEYAPQPFCYAVRRPAHDPEGVLSIEDGENSPVGTLVRRLPEELAGPIEVRLSAATAITLGGERFLHGYVCNSFAGASVGGLSLVARARQFSSFVLIVGRMLSHDSFDPEHALLVQNKDDLRIPLMLEQLPSAKEFKDAIESLSPEQQRFAKAYRAMQLEGTVLGMAVIQLKPQLELLLNLPDDALTKEIKLTQDLFELFQEHQISSDLLSYDGAADAPTADKIAAVREHVQKIMDMIKEEKKAEIESAREESEFMNPELYAPRGGFGSAPEGAFTFGSNSAVMECSADGPPPMARGGGGMAFGAKQQKKKSARGGMPEMARSMARPMAMAMAPPPPAMANRAAPAKSAGEPSPSAPQHPPQEQRQQHGGAQPDADAALDFSQIPAALDARFLALDKDGALRPTTIKLGESWTMKSKKTLLGKPTTSTLRKDAQKERKDAAFDLLDALTRSGALPLDCASFHVVVAATHCFDQSLMDTVVCDNVNPIEKVECSALIVASTIQSVPQPLALVKDDAVAALEQFSPVLAIAGGADGGA